MILYPGGSSSMSLRRTRGEWGQTFSLESVFSFLCLGLELPPPTAGTGALSFCKLKQELGVSLCPEAVLTFKH